MDPTSGSFSYSPLNPDVAEIRLLTISPEKNENSPVECSLQIVSLDNQPRFEALSYVWGDVTEKVEIFVDSISFQVTTNLQAALRCLRNSRKKRIIWIDFICIDQNNVKEKNKQLPLMGRIYREATTVVSWLGPITPNMEQTLLMIKRRESSLAGMLWDVRQKGPWGQKSRREMIGSIVDAIHGFHEIVSSSYWGRIWTFQEYYLPKELPVCMVGSLQFTLPSVVELGRHFTEILAPFMEDFDKVAPRPGDADDIDSHKKLRSRLKEAQELLTQSNPSKDFTHDMVSNRKGVSSFADVLDLTVTRQCFNPLDRFYGLYALVDGVQKKYRVDYENDVDTAALQVTLWILIYEGIDFVFNMFHFYEGRHGSIMGDPSPSWVPNYRDATSRTDFRFKGIDSSLQDRESGGHMTNLSLLPGKYVLHFWAWPLGRTRVNFTFPEDVPGIAKKILDVIDEPDTTWGNDIGQENMAERLIWAFLAHTRLQQDFSLDDIRRSLEGIATSSPLSEPSERHLLSGLQSLSGRTVFHLTDCPTGGFGIGVGNIQDGDLLILSGKMMHPLALRESGFRDVRDVDIENWENDEEVVYYNMIGNAFVEGIAEDQKERPTPLLPEIRGQEFKEFLII